MNGTSQSKVNMDPNAKLSVVERIAYGLGDYSGNLIYSSISAFLLIYYTNVVGVNAATAASVMAISRMFDGVSDLVMGRIVDRTHSRFGKARPWIIRLCIPMAVCTVLMFSVPSSWASSAQVAYMFITYNMVSTICYTGINVPYATLQGLMTTNQYERGLLGNFRMLLATAGTMTVNTVVYQLTAFFGGGDQWSQQGWTLCFVVLMILYLILNLFTFLFCHERVKDEPAEEDGEKAKEPSVWESLKALFRNRYWLLMVVFLFSLYFMMSTFFGGASYYAEYVLGDVNLYATISNPLSMAQIAVMFLTPFIMKRIGKRWTALIGMCVATVSFVLTGLAGTNVTLVVICNILKGAAFGMGAATMFGMLQDAITYGSWKTGVTAMGMGNAASSFCMKIGSGIGTAALGWILSAGNFDADPTSASAVAAINVAYIWVPVITCVIGILCMVFFDLDKKYDMILKDLAEGKTAKDHENDENSDDQKAVDQKADDQKADDQEVKDEGTDESPKEGDDQS